MNSLNYKLIINNKYKFRLWGYNEIVDTKLFFYFKWILQESSTAIACCVPVTISSDDFFFKRNSHCTVNWTAFYTEYVTAFLEVTSYRDCSRMIVMYLRNYFNSQCIQLQIWECVSRKRPSNSRFNNKFLMWFHFHCIWPLYCLKSWSCCLRNCCLAS